MTQQKAEMTEAELNYLQQWDYVDPNGVDTGRWQREQVRGQQWLEKNLEPFLKRIELKRKLSTTTKT